MTLAGDTFESRVSRYLDGELTAQQQADLLRDVMRDPAARSTLEATQTIDRLAGEAMSIALGEQHATTPQQPMRTVRRPARWARLAVAAAVCLTVGLVAWQVGGPLTAPPTTSNPVGTLAAQPGEGPGVDAATTVAADDADADGDTLTYEGLLFDLPAQLRAEGRLASDSASPDTRTSTGDALPGDSLPGGTRIYRWFDTDKQKIYWVEVEVGQPKPPVAKADDTDL